MRKQLIVLCCLFAAASSQAAPAVTDRTPTAKPAAVANASGYTAKTERGRLAQQIVRKWVGYVQKVYGTAPMDWSRAMNDTFAQADIANLRAAVRFQTFEAMSAQLLGQKASDAKVINALAKDSSKANILALGSPAEDLVYTMLTPCRIVDTRNAGGALKAGVVKSFSGNGANFTAQGGSPTDCGIPAEASALVLNATVVNTDGPGHLRLFPFDPTNGPPPEAASLNYVKGQTVGNEVIVKQTLGQAFDFSAFSVFGTDLVIDVAGYFMAPKATALECENVLDPIVQTVPSNTAGTSTSAACPAGYTVISGVCNTGGSLARTTRIVDEFINPNGNTYSCTIFNGAEHGPAGNTERLIASARCCRVPGR